MPGCQHNADDQYERKERQSTSRHAHQHMRLRRLDVRRHQTGNQVEGLIERQRRHSIKSKRGELHRTNHKSLSMRATGFTPERARWQTCSIAFKGVHPMWRFRAIGRDCANTGDVIR